MKGKFGIARVAVCVRIKCHRIEPKCSEQAEYSMPVRCTHTNVTCIRKNPIAMCNVVSRLFYSACSVSRAFQLIRSGYLGIHRVCMCCVYHIVNKLESSVIDISCLQSHSHSHSPISRCEKTIAWAIANYDKIMVFSSGLIKCFSGGMSIDPIDWIESAVQFIWTQRKKMENQRKSETFQNFNEKKKMRFDLIWFESQLTT